MAYITVDVDLDEIDFDEIISELAYRLGSKHFNKRDLDNANREKLEQITFALTKYLSSETVISLDSAYPQIKTLDDSIKMEAVKNVWDRCNSIQLENALSQL